MIGQKFTTKHCGDVVVVEYKNREAVTVEFVDTGHRVTTKKATLVRTANPALRDPNAPTVFGVGRIGAGPHRAHVKGADTRPFSIWRAMLRRCYYRNAAHHQKSYEGVSVCDAWLNFQTFAQWYADNHPNDGSPYQLDKDIRGDGRTYSPESCAFVPQTDNLSARRWSGRA